MNANLEISHAIPEGVELMLEVNDFELWFFDELIEGDHLSKHEATLLWLNGQFENIEFELTEDGCLRINLAFNKTLAPYEKRPRN